MHYYEMPPQSAGQRFEQWWDTYWPVVVFILLFVGALVFVVHANAVTQRDVIACRRRGLDAEPLPGWTFHATCVPRAGHGIDTIYVKTP